MKKEFFQSLPKWLQSNVFYRALLEEDSSKPQGFDKKLTPVHPLDANLISSEKANGKHILMLDLDQENLAVSSTTTGHSHLYINADLSLESLQEIITVLAKHGIVQDGIRRQVEIGECLTFRPPGVKKGVYEDQVDVDEYKQLLSKDNGLEQLKTVNDLDIAKAHGLPQLLQEPLKNKVKDFKQYVEGKTSKHYEVEYAIKKGVFRTNVTAESLSYFIQASFLKLGLDYTQVVIVTDGLSDPFGPGQIGKMIYANQVFAELYYSEPGNQYMVQFSKGSFDSQINIPDNWPKWETLVKVMSGF